MRAATITLLFLLVWGNLLAQDFVIQGNLADENGEDVIGARIYLPDRSAGTISDVYGHFQLSLKSIPDAIILEYPGFHTDTIDLRKRWKAGQQSLNIDHRFRVVEYDFGLPIQIVDIYDFRIKMHLVQASQMQRGDLSSIEQGLNLVPGIKYESRGPGGSRRIAIRGGFLRSPFGVRDVKVYWAGSPLTSPDGSTPLELIDAGTVGLTSVFKGPCAAEFGPVANGVLWFNPAIAASIGSRGGKISQSIGRYGYARTLVELALRKDNSDSVALSYVRQSYAGYRAQEANHKDFLQLGLTHHWLKHALTGNVLLYDGKWELPGALNSAELEADPRQALPISETLDAHVDRRHLRATLGLRSQISQAISLGSSAYLHLSDKTNPFGTSIFNQGYKLERSQGWGTREILGWRYGAINFRVAGEFQAEWLDFRQFDNLPGGQPGMLNTRSKTLSTQAHGFAELKWRYKNNYNHVLVQANLSHLRYRQSEAWSSISLLENGKSAMAPKPNGTLEFAFHPTTLHAFGFFLRAASSYSPPALWELTDTLGQLRKDLGPESGLNFEWRGRFDRHLFHAELNAYHHTIWNTIVPRTFSSGRVDFQNNGRTLQAGIEGLVAFSKKTRSLYAAIQSLRLSLTGGYQHNTFRDYELDGNSFEGKFIPGVPRFSANASLDVETKWRVGLSLTSQTQGKSYLDNANTVDLPAYTLFNLKFNKSILLKKREYGGKLIHSALEPYVGLNNLLNTRYTNFPQLNANFGRYYNPAPGINWFAGIDFRF